MAWCTGWPVLAVPQHRGFALVGDAYRPHSIGGNARFGQRVARGGELGAPDFQRVVLHPAGLGVDLGQFELRLRHDVAAFIEHDAAGAGGALVECEQVGHGRNEFRVQAATVQITPASCNKAGKVQAVVHPGEQPPDLIERGQLHHGRAVELAVVGGQPHLAGLFDDGLRHLHLAVVKVAQRAIGLDARDADERDVHLELADEVHRRLAHDAPVARAHHAASDDDLALGVAAQDGGHVQVVGDDAQAPVVQQRLGNGLGGGADVQDQRAVVGTCSATARAMRALPSACRVSRWVWARFSTVELGTRTPP